jgi:flagellar hook-associated protein 1 FlgK
VSLTTSLSNAVSGLTASSRAAEVVANNVSNAMTEGYGRRELSLSSRVLGGAGAGVRIDGVSRIVDAVLLRDRREAEAGFAFDGGQLAFLEKLAMLAGTPDQDSSLAGQLRRLESTLIEAASRPDSIPRLEAVVSAANGVTGELSRLSEGVQTLRQDADRSISVQVDTLNAELARIVEFNNDIARLNGAGRDVTGLEDQRQQAIDRLSEIVPVREVPRADGRIALYTTGGAILLDGPAPEFGFDPTPIITADMTQASGALSGLTLNGQPVSAYGANAPMGGGSLAAAFSVRDDLGPATQSRLDSVARDLIERFADPAVDPTLAAGDPGLFTDNGLAFDPADEVGLAGRITLSALVDPAQGGQLSALRDGLRAALPRDVGDATQLNALAAALSELRLPASGDVSDSARSAVDLGGDLLSRIQWDMASAETDLGYSQTRLEGLRTLEMSKGVDTDQEMQKLLLIEKSYAANARVIQAVDEMLDQLVRI